MHIEFIQKETVTANQWSGGQTREYSIHPKTALYADRKFAFRISSATIETIPSEFTKFEGYHRYLAMLDGKLTLTINGVDQNYENHELFTFKSTDTITSYSKGTDFNLMLQDTIVDEVVAVRQEPFQTNQPFIMLFALAAGEVVINTQSFEMQLWDCILITNEEEQTVEVQVNQPTIVGYWSMPKIK
ncbi:environmental stress-induced protein Ves [Myroides gitamensis]|uniref:HutD family protein n=1 Tax=Myroides odoratus TaxID=256 RepID=UPI00216AB0E9|nr:HutD family protein [Myroides odoratus]MCS4238099.1 environmental stress-induced protein Ves [Myroides odoratus]MDH6600176.1 environmental stress-induced protein Ves [Myroides gitamensis]